MRTPKTEEKIISDLRGDLKVLLADPRVRRIFQYILTMRPRYAYKPGEPEKTAFLLGQQSICDSLYSMIKDTDRAKLFEMEDEYISYINGFEKDYRKEEEEL